MACELLRQPIDGVSGFMYAVGDWKGVCNIIRRNKMRGLRLTEQEVLTFAVFHTNVRVLSGLKQWEQSHNNSGLTSL